MPAEVSRSFMSPLPADRSLCSRVVAPAHSNAAIRSVLGGAKVVGASGREARPLRGWPPVRSHGAVTARPARGRVLPLFLATVDRHVEHPVAVPQDLAPAP